MNALSGKMLELPAIFEQEVLDVRTAREKLKGHSSSDVARQARELRERILKLPEHKLQVEKQLKDLAQSAKGQEHKIMKKKMKAENALKIAELINEYATQGRTEAEDLHKLLEQQSKIQEDTRKEYDTKKKDYEKQAGTLERKKQRLNSIYENIRKAAEEEHHHDVAYTQAGARSKADLGSLIGLSSMLGIAALPLINSSLLPLLSLAPVGGTLASNIVGKGEGESSGPLRPDLPERSKAFGDLPRGELKSFLREKARIPEIGNLRQSLMHFGMPTVPKILDLPSLADVLGKLPTDQNLKELSLGLPRAFTRSGKEISHDILLNPEFIRQLKRTQKKLGRGGYPKVSKLLGV